MSFMSLPSASVLKAAARVVEEAEAFLEAGKAEGVPASEIYRREKAVSDAVYEWEKAASAHRKDVLEYNTKKA